MAAIDSPRFRPMRSSKSESNSSSVGRVMERDFGLQSLFE